MDQLGLFTQPSEPSPDGFCEGAAEAPRRLEPTRSAAGRVAFTALRTELEALLSGLRSRMDYGPQFVTTWDKAREKLCKDSGWKVAEFYTELSRMNRAG